MNISSKSGIPSGWRKDDREIFISRNPHVAKKNNTSFLSMKILRKREYQEIQRRTGNKKSGSFLNDSQIEPQKYGWRSNRGNYVNWKSQTKEYQNPNRELESRVDIWNKNVNIGSKFQRNEEVYFFDTESKAASNIPSYMNSSTNNMMDQLSLTAEKAINRATDITTSAVPPAVVAKKTYESVKKTAQIIIDNLQHHNNLRKEQEERKKENPTDVSGAVGGVAIMMLLILIICTIIITSITGVISAPLSIGYIIPAAIEILFPVEATIIEVAENEFSIADENIGGQKYKDWYGYDANWCAMFVSYCANECGYIDDGIMPKTASVSNMAEWYKEHEQWKDAEDYTPKAGDIIFFQNDASHVGIVIDFDESKKIIYTIEGNSGSSDTEVYHEGSRVKKDSYPITHTRISGYGLPNYPVLNADESSETN